MDEMQMRGWWIVALRGGVAALFGLLALLLPELTLGRLVSLFGLYALADGGLALLGGARSRGDAGPGRGPLAEGIAGLAAGTLTLLWPDVSVFVLLTPLPLAMQTKRSVTATARDTSLRSASRSRRRSSATRRTAARSPRPRR